MDPGKMVPFQSLTQLLFTAAAGGRGCARRMLLHRERGQPPAPRRVPAEDLAAPRRRPLLPRPASERTPTSPRTRGPGGRLPSRLAPAHGHGFHAAAEEQMDGPGNPPNAR